MRKETVRELLIKGTHQLHFDDKTKGELLLEIIKGYDLRSYKPIDFRYHILREEHKTWGANYSDPISNYEIIKISEIVEELNYEIY